MIGNVDFLNNPVHMIVSCLSLSFSSFNKLFCVEYIARVLECEYSKP